MLITLKRTAPAELDATLDTFAQAPHDGFRSDGEWLNRDRTLQRVPRTTDAPGSDPWKPKFAIGSWWPTTDFHRRFVTRPC